jgi:hypothetical protein
MKQEGFTPQLRSRLFASLTGNQGDVSGEVGGDVRGQLLAAYGTGARGGLNTRAAAKDLGVSQRSVQRWVRGENRPSGTHQQALAKRSRQAATTRAGRRRSLSHARQRRETRYGGRVSVSGDQGPIGEEYHRPRTVSQALDPDAILDMYAAYEAGGDKGLVSWIEGYFSEHYVDEWDIGSISGFTIDDR